MNISRYVKIALFFIVLGGAGTVYIVLSADGINQMNTTSYEVVLQDATGLSTRSKIYLAGVVVGKVQQIELNGTEARLKLGLLRNVELHQDAMLSRKSSSILGTSVLALDPGTELTPLLAPGGFINTDRSGSGDMSAIMGTVQEMGGQITGLLEEFQKNQLALLAVSLQTFNSIAQKIDASTDAQLDNISRILTSTALITERTEGLLRNGETDIGASVTDMHELIANLRAITEDIRAGRGNVGQALYDGELYLSLLRTAQTTEEAAVKLKDALDSVNHLAKNIDGVVTDAGEIVSKATGLGIQVDTNARYDFLSEQVRAAASIRLDPRSNDRWYRIGVSSAPDGVASRTVKQTTDSSGAVTYEDTTETRYSFNIDAELARRFGFLTLRGGLLENSAGIGLDIQPLSWASISGEAFNFRTGEMPNLRGTLTIYPFFDPDSNKPWNWIYFRGGINDALSKNRDFFLGGGLRFADREVKGLVGLVPVLNN
ncbi:MlaD family protein [Leadbettera azotonutricia]|uniref:Putative Mce family protein n=1 Tax=Leadbettera azotonutricia (strain ATCC BAA-888 / DSM 13862 / ZAS-9) TaxID=545695 RepID=F5YBC2_LEAAZ|nr:MlaD family protein [Leadbettera azotonutricia]AEF83425.1 putative Mce family protein [Leadbettera azotonutricia ZAS-9]